MVVHLFFNPNETYGRTLYVSKIGNGQGGDSWETSYQSIQLAIDNSLPNDDIYISNDTYDERVLVTQFVTFHGGIIYGTSSENLESKQMGTTYTTLAYSGYPITAFACKVSCKISGFRISPVSTNCLSLYLSEVNIEDCIIDATEKSLFHIEPDPIV